MVKQCLLFIFVWAENKLLSEYDIVLLVPLRRFSAEDAKSLKVRSLLEMYSGEECATRLLLGSGGESLCADIPGGYELPPELRKMSSLLFQ